MNELGRRRAGPLRGEGQGRGPVQWGAGPVDTMTDRYD